MTTLHRLLLLGLVGCMAAAPLAAQSEGEEDVRAVVDRLFDAMRSADSTTVRSTLHPEARLMTTSLRDGQPVIRAENIDDFVRAVGTPHTEVWDERIADVQIRVDEPLATAWMTYRFYAGDQFSHCGVNAFQFFRGPAGWQIIQIADTRRQSCAE